MKIAFEISGRKRRGARAECGPKAPAFRRADPAVGRAFSLVEIMVAVALMSVIVLGLMAMFNQTQRAFRTGMAQTDILESGRFATDMLAGELTQVSPAGIGQALRFGQFGYNFWSQPVYTNFMALPGGSQFRTNVMDDVFFLVHENQTWTGIGYFVRTNSAVPNSIEPVGNLYRFEMNYTDYQFEQYPSALWNGFLQARAGLNQAAVRRILDGVVDFRVRPVDTDGWLVPYNPAWYTNGLPKSPIQRYGNGSIGYDANVDQVAFWSNAVPASVELELGILESQVMQRYQSIPVTLARQNFLSQQAGAVHLFRQRIAVRRVDPSAYQ